MFLLTVYLFSARFGPGAEFSVFYSFDDSVSIPYDEPVRSDEEGRSYN